MGAIIQVRPPDESNGGGWLALHPDDQSIAKEAWMLAAEAGEYHAEMRIRRHDGSYRWFQTRGEALRDNDMPSSEWIGTRPMLMICASYNLK